MTDTLFQRGSTYQQFRPDYPDALFAWLAGQCQEHDLVVDLGCGTGQACRGLEPWFKQVIGLDISPAQLQGAPLSQSRYLAGHAHQLPFADNSLDLITIAQAFHWFDQQQVFAEAERCLKPGGLLALISYGLCEIEGLGSLIQEYHDGPLGPWWPKERATLMANYPNATLPWPNAHYPGAFLEHHWSLQDMLGYLDTWSALVQARKVGEDPLADFTPVLSKAWGDGKRAVRWPLRVKAWHKPQRNA